VLLVVIPGISCEELGSDDDDDGDDNSFRRVAEDTGSMISWPLWIAESTDLRESQLRDGARSNRTAGSLGIKETDVRTLFN
jgi:hypothetical protein